MPISDLSSDNSSLLEDATIWIDNFLQGSSGAGCGISNNKDLQNTTRYQKGALDIETDRAQNRLSKTKDRKGSEESRNDCSSGADRISEKSPLKKRRHKDVKSSTDLPHVPRDFLTDFSLLKWTSFCNMSGSENIEGNKPTDEDDDTSVLSISALSTLSLSESQVGSIPGLQCGKHDLSQILDDDSTVGSSDINREQDIENSHKITKDMSLKKSSNFHGRKAEVEITSILEKNTKPNSLQKVFNHQNSNLNMKGVTTRSIKGNPTAEKKRKELLKELRVAISSHGRHEVPVAKVVTRLAEFHENNDQHDMAVMLLKEAVSIYSAKLGDHNPAVIDIQIRLGYMKETLGHFEEALEFLDKALFMTVAMYGNYHIDASNISSHIARIHEKQGRDKETVKFLKKSLRGYRETFGDEHIKVANTVCKLADLYTRLKNDEKACAIRGELVKLRIALHGMKSIEVTDAMKAWALTYEAVGDLSRALKIMKQSYIQYHDIEGPESERTESALERIAFLYKELDRSDKALKAHTSVVVIRRKRCGHHHPETAASYVSLGKAFVDVRLFEKALKSFNRAMSIYGISNTDNRYIHPMMNTLHEISITYQKMGRMEEALKALFREHSIRKKMVNYNELSIAKTVSAIGLVYYDLKKYEESKNFLIEGLLLYDKTEGRTIVFANTLFRCGMAFEGLSARDKALQCFFDALMIYKANGMKDGHEPVERLKAKFTNSSRWVDRLKQTSPNFSCLLLDEKKRINSICKN